MSRVADLGVKIFADGADIAGILALAKNPVIKGFTTNPTLMRKAGIADYEAFAHEVLAAIKDRPVSFEVFADEFDEMERQAKLIATWGDGVFVKIPITNTRGESAVPLIRRLSRGGVKLNVTAILTLQQVRDVVEALDPSVPAIVSVFAGRIADTGRDPVPMMKEARAIVDATAYASKAENRKQIAEAIAPANYINAPVTVLEQVLTGTYADGLGGVKTDAKRVDFDPFPWQSFAVWMLTQMKRWGQIKGDVDYAAVAKQVFLATDTTKLMREVGLTPPAATSKSFVVMGKTFDPAKPEDYLKSFTIKRSA